MVSDKGICHPTFIPSRKRTAFTRLVKPFARLRLVIESLRLSMTRKLSFACAHSYGFTLAETIIVLVALGIIAVLVVPSLVNKNQERQNKVKIKKALSTYENAIQQMIIAENIKSEDTLKSTGCSTTKNYFKVAETQGDCQFRTADGLWWDVGSADGISAARTLVSFKKDDLKNEIAQASNKENKAFYFITSYDGNARGFKNDDLNFEAELGSYFDDVAKVYSYLGLSDEAYIKKMKTYTNSVSYKCKNETGNKCVVDGVTYKKLQTPLTGGDYTVTSGACMIDGVPYKSGECPASKVRENLNWVSESFTLSGDDAAKANGNYHEAAKIKCAESGGYLANAAELEATYKNVPGDIWAVEENQSGGAFYFHGGKGFLTRAQSHYGCRVVCVGN